MVVILGGKKPCVIELNSNTAAVLVGDDVPTNKVPVTVAFPLTASVPDIVLSPAKV